MRFTSGVAGAVALSAALALPVPGAGARAESCPGANTVVDAASLAAAVDATLCLVNAERARQDAGAVHLQAALARSARTFSRDMVARHFFAHVTPDGGRFRERVRRSGYIPRRGTWDAGETIAWGAGPAATPSHLVSSLLASASHHDIVLARVYRDVGVGLVMGAPVDTRAGGVTLTLHFGRR
jgi:uncharacterized protein YkwD